MQGKVRDTYVVGDKLVIVTTDRQSAFDRLLASIPFKVPELITSRKALYSVLVKASLPSLRRHLPSYSQQQATQCSCMAWNGSCTASHSMSIMRVSMQDGDRSVWVLCRGRS